MAEWAKTLLKSQAVPMLAHRSPSPFLLELNAWSHKQKFLSAKEYLISSLRRIEDQKKASGNENGPPSTGAGPMKRSPLPIGRNGSAGPGLNTAISRVGFKLFWENVFSLAIPQTSKSNVQQENRE